MTGEVVSMRNPKGAGRKPLITKVLLRIIKENPGTNRRIMCDLSGFPSAQVDGAVNHLRKMGKIVSYRNSTSNDGAGLRSYYYLKEDADLFYKQHGVAQPEAPKASLEGTLDQLTDLLAERVLEKVMAKLGGKAA